MLTIEHTCIKKGNYLVVSEPEPEANPDTSTEPDFDDYPVEIDYPDYDQDYGYFDEGREVYWDTVDSETDNEEDEDEWELDESGRYYVRFNRETGMNEYYYPDLDDPDYDENDLENGWFPPCPDTSDHYQDTSDHYQDTSDHYHDTSEHLDFDSIVREVREDIKGNKFVDKFLHYMKLLKVDREEFEDYLIYDMSNFDDDDFDPTEIVYQVNEVKVFERLFSLYCQDNGFVIPAQTNHHLREYLDKLDKDGRLVTKNQLSLFGEA